MGRNIPEEKKVPGEQNSSFGAGYRIGQGGPKGNNSSLGNGYKMGVDKEKE